MSVCAVRGFVRTHFLPFTRSDRESRTTLHLSNLWTKPHGFNPYFLQFWSPFNSVESGLHSQKHCLVCFCQVFSLGYAFLKFCSKMATALWMGNLGAC